MDFALALRHIWRHRLWLIPVVLVAVIAALSVKSGSLDSGAAKLGLVLDSRESTIAPRAESVAALAQRAVLYAQLLKSQPVRKLIGERTGVPWQTISVDGQVAEQQTTTSQPGQVQRSAELVDERSSTRLYFTVNPNYPIINLYAQAPRARTAIRLVQGAADSLTEYTSNLQTELEVPVPRRAKLLQLGDPQGGEVAPGANVSIAVIVALAVLFGGCFLILYIPRVVTAVRRADDSQSDWPSDEQWMATLDQPLPNEAVSHRSIRQVEPSRESGPPR